MTDYIPQYIQEKQNSHIRRAIMRMDWSLLTAAVLLSLMGLFFIYSASAHSGQGHTYLFRQSLALCFGIIGMTLLMILPYQIFQTYAKWIYIISLILLVAILFFGTRMRGSKSWFNLHWFYFQPVEITRLALAVAIAAYTEINHKNLQRWQGFIIPFALMGTHLGLILMQPDLSSSMALGPMGLAILFAAGASIPILTAVITMGGLALGIPLISTYFTLMGDKFQHHPFISWLARAFTQQIPFIQFWIGICVLIIGLWWFLRKWRIHIPLVYLICTLAIVCSGVVGSFGVKRALKDYQKKRLIAFVDPEVDPLGAGYNILQSQIAIGSGRFLGKGYMSGSQTQLGFLPEKRTDFIFSLVGEEKGFFGALLVLALYFWVVWRAYDIATLARDKFGRFLAVAIGTFFAFSGIVNIGMVMGMMPVTGIPLPFLSYGGSGLVGSFIAIGILLSIHIRRYSL